MGVACWVIAAKVDCGMFRPMYTLQRCIQLTGNADAGSEDFDVWYIFEETGINTSGRLDAESLL